MKAVGQACSCWIPSLLAGALSVQLGASTPTERATTRPGEYVCGLSPFLDDADKDAVFRGLVRFVLEDLPLGSSLRIYDAYHLRTITGIEVPEAQAFRSAKTRANQSKDRLQELRRFLATPHEQPRVQGMSFDRAVRLPQFLQFISANVRQPDQPLLVLVLGSPLYLDDKEPAFSMVNGYFPSDGHLLAGQDRTVFGLREPRESLEGVTVHWGYFGDPWVSGIHEQKIARFWRLFLDEQGARLASFTGDLPTVFSAVRDWVAVPADRPCPDSLDRAQTKVEMLRITRDLEVTDWITRDLSGMPRPGPPSTSVGPLKIGIRWQGNLDLDLYSRPHREGETLFFRHTRSDDGYYFKDHRSSPDREYEFIEFLSPVDVRQMEAFVNFYEGRMPGGVSGEVRIEFEGKIYSGRFTLGAERGNQGRAGGGQGEHWATLDVPRLLGLR